VLSELQSKILLCVPNPFRNRDADSELAIAIAAFPDNWSRADPFHNPQIALLRPISGFY
jgi:hypothetical protein